MRLRPVFFLILTLTAYAFAADPTYSDILKAFQYRNLGPWRTGAWVSSLAVPETPTKPVPNN